jgi:hypothetical protein
MNTYLSFLTKDRRKVMVDWNSAWVSERDIFGAPGIVEVARSELLLDRMLIMSPRRLYTGLLDRFDSSVKNMHARSRTFSEESFRHMTTWLTCKVRK